MFGEHMNAVIKPFRLSCVLYVILAAGCCEVTTPEDTKLHTLDDHFVFELDDVMKTIPEKYYGNIMLRDAYLRGYYAGVHKAFERYLRPDAPLVISCGPMLLDGQGQARREAEEQGHSDGYDKVMKMCDLITGSK